MDASRAPVAIEKKCVAANTGGVMQHNGGNRRRRYRRIGQISAAFENAHRRERRQRMSRNGGQLLSVNRRAGGIPRRRAAHGIRAASRNDSMSEVRKRNLRAS